jgi:hypothetical protein
MSITRPGWAHAAVLFAFLLAGCEALPTAPDFVPANSDAVLVGAGDIAQCGGPGPALTAALLDVTGGTVFTAGDNVYPAGSLDDYVRCYEPTWGRHRNRTLPTPGNHDYDNPGAAAYFSYFGARAGPPGEGYYSTAVGRWLILSLNSNIDASAGSPQVSWLRTTLDQFQGGRCLAAIWHHPVVASGPNGGSRRMAEVWRILHDAGADVVIAAHEHLYERYGPLDGQYQPAPRGIRQFIVGTGGGTLTHVVALRPGSQVQASVWGVLKLTLRPESYRWEFLPAEGHAFRDQGEDFCR